MKIMIIVRWVISDETNRPNGHRKTCPFAFYATSASAYLTPIKSKNLKRVM